MQKQDQLYTLFIDYMGGTYLNQAHGRGPLDGIVNCLRDITVEDIPSFSERDKIELIVGVREDGLVAIDDVTNVWLARVTLNDQQVMLKLVSTCESV